jgi:hypothetical protein
MPLKTSMDDGATPMEARRAKMQKVKERKAKAKMARVLGFPRVSGLQKEEKTVKASQKGIVERKVEKERQSHVSFAARLVTWPKIDGHPRRFRRLKRSQFSGQCFRLFIYGTRCNFHKQSDQCHSLHNRQSGQVG